ncbi:MAG: cell division protein ZipA C-terminal FtsZ-binding domain-containing protein [Azoarcus sp.]|nr:cell division protein ZipA C-terminal FtsZ-binding domain-containing protein [Azoarcus sp.]
MDGGLQIALIAAGVLVVILVFIYSRWQENRHRKRADDVFGPRHPDVLLDEPQDDDGWRRDPVIADDDDVDDTGIGDGDDGDAERRVDQGGARVPPALPAEVDSRVDCNIRIEATDSAIDVTKLWAAQSQILEGLSRPLIWYAFDDGLNRWRRIDAHSSGAHHWFLAAMQLVDRKGAVGEGDFLRFTGGMQRLAEQFRAVLAEQPTRAEVLGGAAELDRFCAKVDVQIVINLVTAPEQVFLGSEIKPLAKAAGLRLSSDGSFHAVNDKGVTVYALVNSGAELFTRKNLNDLRTEGIALMLDLPRVEQAVEEFEHMMTLAMRLADKLKAIVVDDNGKELGTDDILLIRSSIQRYQDSMAASGIPAGSPLALRLFEA